MSTEGVIITSSNVNEILETDILTFSSKEYWHKFVFHNAAKYDKDTVLETILDFLAPVDLVPVKYLVEGTDTYFLARNCSQAIEKLCLNLMAPIQLQNSTEKVAISIHTCYLSIEDYKINMQSYLKKAIQKRYDESRRGVLDLSKFHKEPELYKVLYCPLSRPKFLLYIFNILKRYLSVTGINLSNNGIHNLKPLEALKDFESLRVLDLSDNKISDLGAVALLGAAVPKLKQISFRWNPVCGNFKSAIEYVNWIKKGIPFIKVIDGIVLKNDIPSLQVWMCKEDSWIVADAFIKHYFTLYDVNRECIEYSYDRNAIFSMTCSVPPSVWNKDTSLDCYKTEGRNLIKLNEKNKIMGPAHLTNTEIAKVLQELPVTEHDPYSFKVDVLYYQETGIVLTVSGVFKDLQDVPRIRSFNRTFAMKKVTQDEYKITNDLYHVTNATREEIQNSFLYKKPCVETDVPSPVVNKEEEQSLVDVVSKLTEMNAAYSKKCLEDCEWDIKKSLEVFLENYISFNIPPEAFMECT